MVSNQELEVFSIVLSGSVFHCVILALGLLPGVQVLQAHLNEELLVADGLRPGADHVIASDSGQATCGQSADAGIDMQVYMAQDVRMKYLKG